MDDIELVVREHFGEYKPGDVISDKEKIKEILAGRNEHHVTKRKARPAAHIAP